MKDAAPTDTPQVCAAARDDTLSSAEWKKSILRSMRRRRSASFLSLYSFIYAFLEEMQCQPPLLFTEYRGFALSPRAYSAAIRPALLILIAAISPRFIARVFIYAHRLFASAPLGLPFTPPLTAPNIDLFIAISVDAEVSRRQFLIFADRRIGFLWYDDF